MADVAFIEVFDTIFSQDFEFKGRRDWVHGPAGSMALGSSSSILWSYSRWGGSFLGSALLNRSRRSWYSGGMADKSGSQVAFEGGAVWALDSSRQAGENNMVNNSTPG